MVVLPLGDASLVAVGVHYWDRLLETASGAAALSGRRRDGRPAASGHRFEARSSLPPPVPAHAQAELAALESRSVLQRIVAAVAVDLYRRVRSHGEAEG